MDQPAGGHGTLDADAGDLWVFGYGSLMWRPGFAHVEAAKAVVVGYRRSFCVYSTHHRGTADRPGLVLGLDSGGTCHGLAFRVADADRRNVLAYLRSREQINGVYREVLVPIEVQGEPRRQVLAVAYVVERAHPSYTGPLTLAEQARIIRTARGISGANVDYLANTVARAQALGLEARDLTRLLTIVGPFFGRAARRGMTESPQSKALIRVRWHDRPCPCQPPIGERRRFRFRMNREAAGDPGRR